MTKGLVYAFDPLCGWCYGFGGALRALRKARPDLQIALRMGGLVTGERIGPYSAAAEYIRTASARMTAVTGAALGAGFWQNIIGNAEVVSSSIPPCDVLLQVRRNAPERVLDLAEAIQIAHFRDGQDLNDAATYVRLFEACDIDMLPDVPDPRELRADLAQEFAQSRTMGLASYPTLLLRTDHGSTAIRVSYDPEELITNVEKAVGKAI